MDPGGSDSDEEERISWEVVASDPDSGVSDFNGDVQVHDHHDITLLAQHFGSPLQEQDGGGEQDRQEVEKSPCPSRGREEASSSSSVKDWIEPVDDQQGPEQQHDSDLLETLVSSVLESEPERRESPESQRDSLDREVLGEAGFSSLVPSDLHGNVLRPEDQEDGGGDGDGDGEMEGFGGGWGWNEAIAGYIRRASTLWSITIAAAVMGLVIIGQRWRNERWQNQQLRLQLCYKDERISQLLFQIARLKETVSGRRRVPVIKAGSV